MPQERILTAAGGLFATFILFKSFKISIRKTLIVQHLSNSYNCAYKCISGSCTQQDSILSIVRFMIYIFSKVIMAQIPIPSLLMLIISFRMSFCSYFNHTDKSLILSLSYCFICTHNVKNIPN